MSDTTSLRAGIAPLGLFPSLEYRRVDVIAGYQHDSGRAIGADRLAGATNDAYVALGAYPVVNEQPTGGFSRVGLFTHGRLIWDDATRTQGWGTSFQLTGELGGFFRDRSPKHHEWEAAEAGPRCGPRTDTWGVVGEAAVGLFLEAGYARLGPLDIWSSTLGLSIRLPAAGYTAATSNLRSRRCCCGARL